MPKHGRQNFGHSEPKNAIRRVDVEIVRRMIIALHDYGGQRKTKIALNTHVSYDKCLKYLKWLELMGLTRKENRQGFDIIYLTEKGLDLYSTYSQISN